jgi:chain length determinant protein (polysaccharide antigen chain regulator)
MEQQAEVVYGSGEIDVIGTLGLIWKEKWLVFFVTLLTTVVGCLYIWMAKPIFEAKAYITPPTAGDIAAFNHGRSNAKGELLKLFDVGDIYAILSSALLSQGSKRAFFDKVYLPSLSVKQRTKMPLSLLYKEFNTLLTVKEDAKYTPARFTVIAKSSDVAQAVDWVERYVGLVKQNATDHILRIISSQNKSMTHDLEQRISVAREMAKEQRLDRINQLNEALNISNAIGLTRQDFSSTENMRMEISSINKPSLMYKRGSEALKAEIKNLNLRQSDDSFTPEVRKLESKYKLLGRIVVNPVDVAVFRLDGNIDASDVPIAPKSRLITAFSLTLGLLLGVSTVLVRAAFATNRAERLLAI